jgi:hypothetical protein
MNIIRQDHLELGLARVRSTAARSGDTRERAYAATVLAHIENLEEKLKMQQSGQYLAVPFEGAAPVLEILKCTCRSVEVATGCPVHSTIEIVGRYT